MSESSFRMEVIDLTGTDSPRAVADTVLGSVSRLLLGVMMDGGRVTSGDLRVRTRYNKAYLRDEIILTWERAGD